MTRRRAPASGSLTSLLDVLFILVFAALVQASTRPTPARATAAPTPPPTVAPPDAVRATATAILTDQLAHAPIAVVRLRADGVLLEVDGGDGPRGMGAPLLVTDPDRDVGVRYAADLDPSLGLCPRVTRALATTSLAGWVIAIAPAVSRAELPVALVTGLERDAARCQRDHGATPVLVEPGAIAPGAAPAPEEP